MNPNLEVITASTHDLTLSVGGPVVNMGRYVKRIRIKGLSANTIGPISLCMDKNGDRMVTCRDKECEVFNRALSVTVNGYVSRFKHRANLNRPKNPIIRGLTGRNSCVSLPCIMGKVSFSFSKLLSTTLERTGGKAPVRSVYFSLRRATFSVLIRMARHTLSRARGSRIVLYKNITTGSELHRVLGAVTRRRSTGFCVPRVGLYKSGNMVVT